jgi:hypothetical protein
MAPRIRAIADQLADELFAQGSRADLVARYARMLPLSVICELLGLPLADRPKFMGWANRATSASSVLVFLRMVPTLVAIKRYLQQRLEHARAVGGQGLIAELVQVEKEGAPISSEEMVASVRGSRRISLAVQSSSSRKTLDCVTGWQRTGAEPTWRSRNSYGLSRRCQFSKPRFVAPGQGPTTNNAPSINTNNTNNSFSGCMFAAGSWLAATSMATIWSPRLSRTPPSSISCRNIRL